METNNSTWNFEWIETPRLKVEFIDKRFVSEIFEARKSEKVNAYLAAKSAPTVEALSNWIDSVMVDNQNHEIIQMQVSLKETSEFIGMCGIKKPNSGHPEIGLWFKESALGRGYGKELVWALVGWIEGNLDYEYFVYETYEDNIGSVKVIEWLGGVRQPEIEQKENYYGVAMPHVQYRIYKK